MFEKKKFFFYFQKNIFNKNILYVCYLKEIYFFVESNYGLMKDICYLIYFFKIRGLNFKILNFYKNNFNKNGIDFYSVNLFNFDYKFILNFIVTIFNYYKLNLKSIIKNFSCKNLYYMLFLLNFNIKNWLSIYFSVINNLYLFLKLDIYVSKLLWNKFKSYHSKKSNVWIYSKYWKCFSGIWRFYIINKINGKILFLNYHFDLINCFFNQIPYRIFKCLYLYNLYNGRKGRDILIEIFKYKFLLGPNYLFIKQKGVCFICKKPIYSRRFKIVNLKYNKCRFLEDLCLLHIYCDFI